MNIRRVAASLVLACSLVACSATGQDVVSSPERDRGAAQVEVDGTDLRLTFPDGSDRVVPGVLDPRRDGEVIYASIRPGDHERVTVLALAQVDDLDGRRYELRYLSIGEAGASDLYWFPWRLQVDDQLTATLDAAPRPVWAPDGSALAWVEWGTDGTRLRTVAWRDEPGASNPSDDASAFSLSEVPPGTQLLAWERGSDDVPVLVGTDGETIWRIRIDLLGGKVEFVDAAIS